MKNEALLVGIGELVSIDWCPIGGGIVSRTKAPGKKWLAWYGDSNQGDLIIASMVRRRTGVRVADGRHTKFHAAPVQELAEIEWDEPNRKTLTPVGLCCAVRYRIPEGMPSNKSGNDWQHDFGEKVPGVMRHADRYKPFLSRDSHGGLFIVRRAGNDYRLDTWLRG